MRGCVFGGIITVLYINIPLTLAYGDYSEPALKFYSCETNEQLKLLSGSSDEREAEALAEKILVQNETCSLAYDALAIVAVNEARYEEAVAYMKKSIEYNRFEAQGYEPDNRYMGNKFRFYYGKCRGS